MDTRAIAAIAAVVGVVATIAAGLVVFGQFMGTLGSLERQVAQLDPDAIRRARDEAVEAIRRAQPVYDREPEEFTLEVPQDDPVEKKMIPVSEGICYLVRIGGSFAGRKEDVSIAIKGDYWYLVGRSDRPTNPGRAVVAARCWKWPT